MKIARQKTIDMYSDDESTESFYSSESGSDDEIDYNDLENDPFICWINKIILYNKGRCDLLDQLYPLISDWKGQLPNLRDIFRREEIEFLLTESINYKKVNDNRGQLFIEFVVRCGYKDEPDVDENGKPLLRRTTALHHAAKLLSFQEHTVVRELFKIYNRFDVNYISRWGITHFHVACQFGCYDVVEKFLELGQDPNILVPKIGDSPLHLAVKEGRNEEVISLLLLKGANPNLANNEELTPLHVISRREEDTDVLEIFFKINDDIQQTVQVEARDKEVRTPLHWALLCDNKKVAESLLRRGANANLTDLNDDTPLRICLRKGYDDLVTIFFEMNAGIHQPVQVKGGVCETPLQWAVANILPHTVEVLLDHGADQSSFVFPTASDFSWIWMQWYHSISLAPVPVILVNYTRPDFILRQASGLLLIVDSLEKRGYELKRSDALKIMTFFDYNDMFVEFLDADSWDYGKLDKYWYDDEEFKNIAKEMMIKPSLSLYDLIQLKPEEAAKQLTNMDYFEFARSEKMCKFHEKYHTAIAVNLCEKMARRFFQRWALDSSMKLTHKRSLTNLNLYNICLAASGQTSWWRNIRILPDTDRSLDIFYRCFANYVFHILVLITIFFLTADLAADNQSIFMILFSEVIILLVIPFRVFFC